MSVVDASLLVRVLAADPSDETIRQRLSDPADHLHTHSARVETY